MQECLDDRGAEVSIFLTFICIAMSVGALIIGSVVSVESKGVSVFNAIGAAFMFCIYPLTSFLFLCLAIALCYADELLALLGAAG